jgi:hypothetical protein
MLSGAFANGAVAYLGAPNFAVDSVADENGVLHRTPGRSMVASYEHLWTPRLKSSLTFSLYGMSMASGQANVGSALATTPFDFQFRVRGSAIQLGSEYLVSPDVALGGEVAVFHDRAQGFYAGLSGGAVNPAYATTRLYLRTFF